MPGQSYRSELVFLIAAAVLCLLGGAYLYLTAPTRLTVAVAAADEPDSELLKRFAEELARQRRPLRIELRPVADLGAAAKALEGSRVDLAVVRPDAALPANGLTVAILREAAAIAIAPKAAKIADMADMSGKRLGVVVGQDGDPALFETVLRHFSLQPPPAIAPLPGRPEALAAFRERRVDAVGFVAEASARGTAEFVRDLAAAAGGPVAAVATEVAPALASTNLAIAADTLAAGLWSGRPKMPEAEVATVGVSYRLMARQDVDRGAVALVAENLFQMRSRLAEHVRSANLMRPPNTDASSTDRNLPNHPGAVDYFQREQQRFIDKYGEWIYIVALFGSGLVSALAGLRQRFVRRRREEIDDVLDRLLAILAEARRADSPARLDALTAEVDGLLSTAISHARHKRTGSRVTSALVLALDGARAAVADRRREIDARSGDPPAPDATAPSHEACEVAAAVG